MNECIGDETSIAHQNLIVNVDGSGSVNTGFEISLKTYGQVSSSSVTRRSASGTLRIGVAPLATVCVIESVGTISKASLASEFDDDLAAVKTAVA